MPMHPATRRFLTESLRATRSVVNTLHGYVYLRWPFWYISQCRGKPGASGSMFSPGWWIERMPQSWLQTFLSRFADGYHAKVITPETAQSLIQPERGNRLIPARLIPVDRPLSLPQPETVLPYTRAREILLHSNAAVALMQCPCRLSLPVHCEPSDVCILVGDTVVNFVLAHHKDKARRVSPDEALEVIRSCHEQGMVTHAFFKAAVLNRFYAICNCCTCCCAAMQGHFHGVPMLSPSGYQISVNAACTGCGRCVKRCPFKALKASDSYPKKITPDPALCMGCGVCLQACPQQALDLIQSGDVKPLVL